MNTRPMPHAPKMPRYGVVFAKIGSTHPHALEEKYQHWPQGFELNLDVHDISRQPKSVREAAVWVCKHPKCAGKQYASKEELLEAHPAERTFASTNNLGGVRETHLCMAIATLPAVKAEPEVRDEKTGKIARNGVEARPATLALLSDEEWS